MTDAATTTEERARRSLGSSGDAVYRMVQRALAARHPGGGTLVDVGCGSGGLWPHVRASFARYVGVDVLRYDGFPAEGEFHALDLDRGEVPLPDGIADVAAGVETIEHLENPRAFMRMLVRLTRPGGWVVVTTPNQHSLLSKGTFLLRGEHVHFQDASYPAHITALLEADLRRMAAECGLTDIAVEYSGAGRVPATPRHWPGALARLLPRALSDNLLLAGQKPHG
jgi:2-polyprenyl-3-methyl-5-hydroxy-6-metoxy-1,4-benzoquinol methylase